MLTNMFSESEIERFDVAGYDIVDISDLSCDHIPVV